jgi:hypothetical protein
MNRSVIAAVAGFLAATLQYAAEVRHLTLTEAVHLAISQNRALKIARLKVAESEQKKAGERSAYFPSLKNESNLLHVTDLEKISIPAGAFGMAAGSEVPARNTSLPQGQTTLYTSGTQAADVLEVAQRGMADLIQHRGVHSLEGVGASSKKLNNPVDSRR